MDGERAHYDFIEHWKARDLTGDINALDVGPVANAAQSPRHNLPALLTRFVGREALIAQISESLRPIIHFPARHHSSLLTLTGPGGAGKTRLALEVAVRLAADFPDGAWLVELAAVNDPALVAREVASVLDLREVAGEGVVGSIVEALRNRSLLLILDNCEHLLVACADLVGALLQTCPNISILATTREPLRVEGEAIWTVPSLSLPAKGDVPPAGGIADSEAVRLFIDRARLRRPDFALDETTGEVVTEICWRLEGLPLAIELAAARVSDLSMGEIAARLAHSLDLLVGGRQGAPSHQHTLRAAIEWSYRLLNASERLMFDRLAVFSGGWQLAEAEAVAGRDLPDAREILVRLAGKSLVITEPAGNGLLRGRLLEPIRQYAWEHLEEHGALDDVRARHAEVFLALARQAEVELLGPAQDEWLQRLDLELGNLRMALTWCLVDTSDPGRIEMGLQLASALWRFWHSRGYMGEGRRWLERGLATEGASPSVRARALHRAGWHALIQSDFSRSRILLEESVALYTELGDDVGLSTVLDAMGDLYAYEGDHGRGREMHERGLELTRQHGDTWGTAMALNSLSLFSLHAGDRDTTEQLLREALELVRALGDTRGIAITTHNLGMTALNWNDYEAAAGPLRESLSLFARQGNKHDSCYCLEALARIAGARGQVARAARLFAAAAAIRHDLEAHLSPDRMEWRRRAIIASRGAENERTWEDAWEEGSRLSLAAATAYALHSEEDEVPRGDSTRD